MDFTSIFIGLGVIIALIIIGKIFAVLAKVFFIIILVAAIAVGIFFWHNYKPEPLENKTGYIQQIILL